MVDQVNITADGKKFPHPGATAHHSIYKILVYNMQ